MKKIVVLGASGDLGLRISRELASKAEVIAPLRPAAISASGLALERLGIKPVSVGEWDANQLARIFDDADTVLSALSGLRGAIIDAQSIALEAAALAGVRKFMPSDFAVDYRRVARGANRNLNLREEFRQIADSNGIRLTSILNGAFMDMLSGVAPFILFRFNRVLCWGSPDQTMDWTLIDDVAKYTAYAALDPNSPRFLNISGSVVSANDLAKTMSELTNKDFRVFRPGGLALFKQMIAMTKLFVGGHDEVYPAWQGMQYMHSMYEGNCKLSSNDNARYPVHFTTVTEYLQRFLRSEVPAYVLNTRKGLV